MRPTNYIEGTGLAIFCISPVFIKLFSPKSQHANKIQVAMPPLRVLHCKVVPPKTFDGTSSVPVPTELSADKEPEPEKDPAEVEAQQKDLKSKIHYMDVSENRGTPKSSILIGFSIINHPFWGTPIFGNTHISFFFLDGGGGFKYFFCTLFGEMMTLQRG